jgi:hypothetical protein
MTYTWNPMPLPKPEFVHADSMVIVMWDDNGKPACAIVVSDGKDWRIVGDTNKTDPGMMFMYRATNNPQWTWSKSFHAQGEI